MAYHIEPTNDFTSHARQRMSTRSINEWHIDQVIRYGRESHTRKAVIYAIGKKEVKEHGRFLEKCEGIHVLCSPADGAIITTYRNHDLKGLKH
ncbi:MAG: DUF4258 domain-containing protein [Desulfuromonadales bacterium]